MSLAGLDAIGAGRSSISHGRLRERGRCSWRATRSATEFESGIGDRSARWAPTGRSSAGSRASSGFAERRRRSSRRLPRPSASARSVSAASGSTTCPAKPPRSGGRARPLPPERRPRGRRLGSAAAARARPLPPESAPGRIRTCDLSLRRGALYPAELRALGGQSRPRNQASHPRSGAGARLRCPHGHGRSSSSAPAARCRRRGGRPRACWRASAASGCCSTAARARSARCSARPGSSRSTRSTSPTCTPTTTSGIPGLLKTYDLNERERPLRVIGPPGLIDLFKALRRIFGRLGYEVELVELEPGRGGAPRRLRGAAVRGRAPDARLRLRAGRGRAPGPLRPRGGRSGWESPPGPTSSACSDGEAGRGQRRPRRRPTR